MKLKRFEITRQKLSAALVLSIWFICAFSIFARAASNQASIGSKNYATLEKALKAVKNGETIRLNTNITTSKMIKLNRNVTFTLDLGGKTIKDTSKDNENMGAYGKTYTGTLHITKGKVTIKNGEIGGSSFGAAITVGKAASLTIAGGTYRRPVANWGGNLTINGGKFMYDSVAAIDNHGGKLVINNAAVSSNNSHCIHSEKGSVKIKKGTFTSKGTGTTFYLVDTKLTVSDIKAKSEYSYCLYLTDKATAKISKGSFTSSKSLSGVAGVMYDSSLTILGGTFKNTYKDSVCAINVDGGDLTVRGGEISNRDAAIMLGKTPDGREPKLTVKGGKISNSSKSSESPIKSYVMKRFTIDFSCVVGNKNSKAVIPADAKKKYSKSFVTYAAGKIKKIQYGWPT